jgi:Ca2+-binding RTX toxin-like protein
MRRTVLLLAVMAACLVVASGVALAVNRVGTNGHDVLKGTDGSDNLLGRGGQDDLFGKGGSDNLSGGPGKDNVLGGGERRIGGGDKNLDGGSGNDVVNGGQGSDNIVGGDGNDFLIDGNLRELSRDNLAGGNGGDVIVVDNVPAVKDIVACGAGFDRVLADRKDTVARDCERVKIVRGSREEVIKQERAFFRSIPGSFFEGLPPNPFR